MTKTSEQLVACHGASQLGSRQAAAGDDHLVARIRRISAAYNKSTLISPNRINFKSGNQFNIAFLQRKPENIYNGIGLVGIGVNPSGLLRNGVKAQRAKPRQRLFHIDSIERSVRKYWGIPVIAAAGGMEIGYITASIACCKQLFTHSRLTLK